jgi:hypothetical protein
MSELDEIRARYEAGKLEPIRRDLERFLVAHRADIDCYRKEQEAKGLALTDEAAVKFFLLRHRTINAQGDIREQLEEIKKETWIRGVQKGCAPDGDEVALEWARSFSAGWRAHRLTTVVYVFEREKERYLALLKG